MAKSLDPVVLNLELARPQVADLRELLAGSSSLGEKADIQPFFAARPQLSLMLGFYAYRLAWPDRIAFEMDIWGEFAADLVVGDWKTGAFCFVEFEDAAEDSLFKKTIRATSEWSRRLEHGVSQLADWFFALNDLRSARGMVSRFGTDEPHAAGVVLIGRDQFCTKQQDRDRLSWREKRTLLDSRHIHLVTYDRFLEECEVRLGAYPAAAAFLSGPMPSGDPQSR